MAHQKRCKTTFKKSALSENVANIFYKFFVTKIKWDEGIRSKNGFTRLAKMLPVGVFPELDNLCYNVLNNMGLNYTILGIYLNYYKDGEMYTPNHSHKGTKQLVISLGAMRELTVGKKTFEMENGDAIVFGSSIHGVPKSKTKEGRISIATFMI